MAGNFTTHDEIRDVHLKRASMYDLVVYGCYLLGFLIGRYRRLAVEALPPENGDTVVEIGCGTRMNFPVLQGKTGPQG